MDQEVRSGNVVYRNDKYRIPTTYNWLPASGNEMSSNGNEERVSANNVYRRAVKQGAFNGSYTEFLSGNSDVIKKYQGEDQKISKKDVPTVISMISPGEVMANIDGPEVKTTIMGVKPWVFYSGLGIVLIGAGFGVYKLLSSKK